MKKILFFDFDGVLANTKKFWVYNVIEVFKLKKIYNPKIKKEIIKSLGQKPGTMLYKLGFPKKIIKSFDKKVFELANKRSDKIRTLNEIKILKKIDCEKIIISNCYPKILKKILKNNKIDFFQEVYGAEDFSTKDKLIKKIIKEKKLKKENVFYVGDKVIDIETAKKSRCKSIIVLKYSWDKKEEIIKNNPDFVVKSLHEIPELINRKKKIIIKRD